MKKFHYLLIGISINAFSQCTPLAWNSNVHSLANYPGLLELNFKTDFCAKGDGVSDDTPAVLKVNQFINNRQGNCKIIIPAGTYRVGSQIDITQPYSLGYAYRGFDMFYVVNKNNVHFEGAGDSTIFLNRDGFKYGAFYPINYSDTSLAGKPYLPPNPFPNSVSNLATIGNIFTFENVNHCSVKNMVLDGNFYPGKVIVGGPIGDPGAPTSVQAYNYGIRTVKVGDLLIENVTSRRFGLDGLYLNNVTTDSLQKKVLIKNCIFDYNGRQGMSWCGGDGIVVKNCTMSNTGKGISFSLPSSGLDIEPEVLPNPSCINGYFENCKFINNKKQGVSFATAFGETSNNTFNNCFFLANFFSGAATDVDGNNNEFINCQIYGTIQCAFKSQTSINQPIKFTNCLISDCYYLNGIRQNLTSNFILGTLISNEFSSQKKNINFNNCIIETYYNKLFRHTGDSLNRSTMNNCNIYINKNVVGSFKPKNYNITNSYIYVYNSGNIDLTNINLLGSSIITNTSTPTCQNIPLIYQANIIEDSVYGKCKGDSIVLGSSIQNNYYGPFVYNWEIIEGDATITSTNNENITILNGSSNSKIKLEVIDFVGHSKIDTITLLANQPKVSILQGSVINLGCNDTLTLKAQVTKNKDSSIIYSWNTGSQDSIIRISNSGEFTVSILNSNNCIDSAKILVNDSCITSNIVETENLVTVFPNPFSKLITFNTPTTINSLEIYSIDGKMVGLFKNIEPNTALNLENLEKGIFILKINIEHHIFTYKIIKQ